MYVRPANLICYKVYDAASQTSHNLYLKTKSGLLIVFPNNGITTNAKRFMIYNECDIKELLKDYTSYNIIYIDCAIVRQNDGYTEVVINKNCKITENFVVYENNSIMDSVNQDYLVLEEL